MHVPDLIIAIPAINIAKPATFISVSDSSKNQTLNEVIITIPIPSHKAYATPKAIFLTENDNNIYEVAIIINIKINPVLLSLTLDHFIDNVPITSVIIASPRKIQYIIIAL